MVEFVSTIINRIVTKNWFDVISEVANKSHSIIEFNFECLIVNGTPSSINFRLTFLALALRSLNLVVLEEVNLPEFFLIEFELMSF